MKRLALPHGKKRADPVRGGKKYPGGEHVRLGKVLTVHGEVDTLMCHHCGAEQQYLLPMAIAVWVAMAKAFSKHHAGCPKPVEEKSNVGVC